MPGGEGGPVTVPRVLASAVASDPGRPRLTWYAADGERVELSARVLANWVAKTANLLVEELLEPPAGGAGGQAPTVLLDLPVHWRTVVWGLSAWAVGAEVVRAVPAAAEPPTVVVTAAPGSAPATDPAGAPLVVLALAALAFSTDDVPPGALDYNAVVSGYGDELPGDVAPLALDLPAARGGTGGTAPRLMVDAVGRDPREVLLEVVAALAADGSVVLRGPGSPDAAHLAEVERVTS